MRSVQRRQNVAFRVVTLRFLKLLRLLDIPVVRRSKKGETLFTSVLTDFQQNVIN